MGRRYLIDPTQPIHKRWMTPLGPIRVMCEPVDGYVMARQLHCVPFTLTVRELLGSAKHPHPLGPFEPVGARFKLPSAAREGEIS